MQDNRKFEDAKEYELMDQKSVDELQSKTDFEKMDHQDEDGSHDDCCRDPEFCLVFE